MKTVKIQRLTVEAFNRYGAFCDMLNPMGKFLGTNPIEFYRDMVVVPITNDNVGLSVTKSYPREKMIVKAEYHDHTGEAMMPLNGDVLIHVAPAGGRGAVPYNEFEVFYVTKGTMVVIRPGVWHHAPFCVGNEPVSNLIILPERTYANDCAQEIFPDEEKILIID